MHHITLQEVAKQKNILSDAESDLQKFVNDGEAVPSNEFHVEIQGNVRPTLQIRFNPRGQMILPARRVINSYGLEFSDCWQLAKDMDAAVADGESLIRMSFSVPEARWNIEYKDE
jgi:hypothetical protein